MRLLEIRANKDSFHTITFNKVGLSIIRAKKVSDDKKGTYNSVGKSLLIYLLHFCLGGEDSNELKEKLPEWEFTLDFEIDGNIYSAIRNTKSQNIIILNEKEYKLKEFKEFMQSLVFFNIPNNFKFLSFRSLINRFIRAKKSSYDKYDCYLIDERKKQYPELLNNSFLLNLDIERINRKRELKEKMDELKKQKFNIENDAIMKEFFTGDIEKKKIDLEILSLERRIERLTRNISDFKVAEDYDSIKKEADIITYKLKQYKNRRSVLKNAINNIDKSLEIRPDIKSKDIKNLFDEARAVISGSIIKRFEEVEDFNRKLLGNRKARLIEEKKQFDIQLKDLEQIIKNLGQKEDNTLYLLKSTGSLEEYAKLNEQYTQIRNRWNKLKSYKELLDSYNIKIDEIKESYARENSETNKYLMKIEDLKKQLTEVFNSFAEQFYENKPSGITISNNDGDNQLRFNIEATIESDSGDAVNNVKIFCFDWTLLKNQFNHNIKYLFHDSRLISEIDPRQIATMFRIAHDNTIENKFQYIISANEKDLNALKDIFTKEEYDKYIENNVIENLTDESDLGKLLGISIDLNYEK